jgi:hypothetical protein
MISLTQLLASDTNSRYWEQLVEFMDKNRNPNDPYIPT